MIRSENGSAQPYVTKDGSVIRELMHPEVHGNRNQSLAEATLPPGGRSLLHRHLQSEELYHILSGQGILTVGGEAEAVFPGDTVCIPPRAEHFIANTGAQPLRFLCCSAPAYRHEDTRLLAVEDEGPPG